MATTTTTTTTKAEAAETAAEELQKNTLAETAETVAAELAAEEHQKRISTTAKLKRALAAKDVDWRVATQSVGVNPDSLPDRGSKEPRNATNAHWPNG